MPEETKNHHFRRAIGANAETDASVILALPHRSPVSDCDIKYPRRWGGSNHRHNAAAYELCRRPVIIIDFGTRCRSVMPSIRKGTICDPFVRHRN